MKTQDAKRQLVVESSIVVVALIILGGVLWGLNSLSDDYTQQGNKLKAQVNNVNSETDTLFQKYNKVKQNTALYQEILTKMRQNDLEISREKAKDVFNKFRSTYFINDLRVAMSGVEELREPKYRRNNAVMVSSPVTISFDATSDEDVYNMFNNMQQDFPGGARITKIKLTRQDGVSDGALRAITQNGTYPLVKGEIQFYWYGIKIPETNDSNTNAPK